MRRSHYEILYVNPVAAVSSAIAQPNSFNGMSAPFAILGGMPEPWMVR